MQYIKGGSSRKINQFLRKSKQPFWAQDSFDHYVRNDEEWLRIVHYILQNPVKAGLVSEWSKWPHTLVQEGVLKVYNASY
jgi:putative transposase